MKSSTKTLISALRILARDIESEDGVANATIAEAADRLEELNREIHADTTRLDWLGSHQGTIEHWEGDWYCEGQMFSTLRAAIDAAIGETQP